MIRLATLDAFEEELLHKLTRIVYQAYGLGCEVVGNVEMPDDVEHDGKLDPVELLKQVEPVTSYADDKVVYLTSRPLLPRSIPNGESPTPGFSEPLKARAVVSSAGMPKGEAMLKPFAKQIVHDIGHLWELHHCLDPRCAMHPPWTPNFEGGEPALCTFCREKSEHRIRLAKT